MADLSSCFTSQEEEKRKSAFAGMSRDSLEELILQLSMEIYRRSLTATKDGEGPFLEKKPDDFTPEENVLKSFLTKSRIYPGEIV